MNENSSNNSTKFNLINHIKFPQLDENKNKNNDLI